MKKVIWILLFTVSCQAAFTEDNPATSSFSIAASPSMMIPLGPGADIFDLGACGRIAVEYSLPVLTSLSFYAGLLYEAQGLRAAAGSISLGAALAGAVYRFPIVAGLSTRAFAGAGYSFGVMNGDDLADGGGSGIAEAGAGLSYAFNQNLALRLDLAYQYCFGLFGGLNAALALSVTPPASTVRTMPLPSRPMNLEFGDISLQSVFPILLTWYDQNPVGTVVVKNAGKEAITDVSISFLIKQYMDGPKECASIARLKPGETREVPLYALFNNSVLDVTEATKATSQVDATYIEAGETRSRNKTATIRIFNRNAITWDDDRKAAAFVSGKDPWVQDLSTSVTAMVKDLMNSGIDGNLQLAIAFHHVLRLYGLSYTPSPTTPYSQTSANPEIVDFVRFPRQTLVGRAGDCSDLSILSASLFESVGMETAFITVPGHIFMAVCLETTPAEAKEDIPEYEDLIVRDGKVWLPIETTVLDRGLLDAWREGALEWKRCAADRTAAFYPIHDAWMTYQPVGLAADNTAVKVPGGDLVARAFASELAKYVQRNLDARLSAINGSMAVTGETAKGLNRRGIAYARYGNLDLAEKDFQAAIGKQADHVPALVNLGNLARMRSDAQSAFAYYQRAVKYAPLDAKLLINLALAADSIGDDTAASTAYESANRLDPRLAAQYAFIGEKGSPGTRAAEADQNVVFWLDE